MKELIMIVEIQKNSDILKANKGTWVKEKKFLCVIIK